MASGIVTAAGGGVRLGSGRHKLDVEILGVPLLIYSLFAFERSRSVERIYVVVPPERLDEWSTERLKKRGIGKVKAILAGGDTRQASVKAALEAIPGEEGVVVVHDGARPMVTPELVDAVTDIPPGFTGVITSVPVTDTVKEVEGDVVKSTPDRSRLVAVQTPQAFDLASLRRCHREAESDGFLGTDDASLVERKGGLIRVVEGSRENLKVTYPEDLDRARAILGSRMGA